MIFRYETVVRLLVASVAALMPAALNAEVIIDWVTVGDPGNVADTEVMTDGTTGYGSVDHVYLIGKYEVTNSQYSEFLNTVDPAGVNPYELYNEHMAAPGYGGIIFDAAAVDGSKYTLRAGREHRPIYLVSFWDACRFANWLHNGQGDGDTETGAYALDGITNPPSESVTRNPAALVFIPTEDEWYKAAYYKGGGTDAGYWDYATQNDVAPVVEHPPGGANSANYEFVVQQLTDVGAYLDSPSAYGTFDQNGNVWEMNETIVRETRRGFRGGTCMGSSWPFLHASYRDRAPGSASENVGFGFRVASIPEPSVCAFLVVCIALVLLWRATCRRQAKACGNQP